MAKTPSERFREHLKRQQEKGLVRTTLWIPEGKKKEVQALINSYANEQANNQDKQP
jgi:hypothetical protein